MTISFDVHVEVKCGTGSQQDHIRISTGGIDIVDCYETGLTAAQRAVLKELLDGHAAFSRRVGERVAK